MVKLVGLFMRRSWFIDSEMNLLFYLFKLLTNLLTGTRSRTRTCTFIPKIPGILNETLNETESCSPEERIWYGETEVATITNDAGIWNSVTELSNIFDDDATTSWHSAAVNEDKTKIITIDFLVRYV